MRHAVLLFTLTVFLPGCAANYSGFSGGSGFTDGHFEGRSSAKRTKAYSSKWIKSRAGVQVARLSPSLKRQLSDIGKHFGKPVNIVSGCRSVTHNKAVGGVNGSLHIRCLAADFYVPGVSKTRVANYVRSMPRRGGLGTYCGKSTIHLDVGRHRSWYKACRSRPKINVPILTGALSGGGSKHANAETASVPSLGMAATNFRQTSLGPGIESLLANNP